MYPTLTSSARSSIRSFLMKRTSFERSANRLRGYHPCCLSLLYHILETLSIKNFNDAVFGVVFYVLALIQTAGRGIHYLSAFPAASPWRQLSPADKLQHRESRERLSVFLLPYPEARSPGFPVSIIPPSLPAALAPIIRRRRVSFLKKKKDIIIILLSENDTLPSNF